MHFDNFFIKLGRVKSSIIITIISTLLSLIFGVIISNIMINHNINVNMNVSIIMSIIIPIFIAFPLSYYIIGLHISLADSKKDTQKLYLESKKINKELNDNRHEITQLFDNASIGLLFINKQRVLIKTNQKTADTFGYKDPKEMAGMSMKELHLSQSRFEEFGKKNFEALKYGERINIEYELKKKDGTPVWCEVSGRVLDQNSPSDFSKGVLWTVKDIDKRKKLEEYKNETQARLEFALEGSTDGLWEWDITNDEVYYSPKWKNILGYEDNEIENKLSSWENLVDPKDKDKTYKHIEKYLQDKMDKFEIKFKMKHKDGHYIPILSRAKKIIDKQNNNVKLIGTHFDLSEIVKYEEQQKEQQQIIFQQSKMTSISELMTNIAHHWRQPLSIISTSATGLELQKKYGVLDDKVLNDAIKFINDNVQYLSKTIDDFGNFISEKKQEKLFNINDTIDTFLNLVKPSIQNNNIEVVFDLEDDLNIFACPTKVVYCLVNLYNNSEEVFKQKEAKLIFISSYKKQSNIVIEFKDNAGGIKQEHLLRVFEPYFTTKHKSLGTGLGLSIAYDLIVNGLKGSLSVINEEFEYDNKKQVGAKFTISIPSKKA